MKLTNVIPQLRAEQIQHVLTAYKEERRERGGREEGERRERGGSEGGDGKLCFLMFNCGSGQHQQLLFLGSR